MPLRINKIEAATLVRAEAARSESEKLDSSWVKKVKTLSHLCEEGVSKTHIAFLGTVMIAKAMHRSADLFAIKPSNATNNPNAFSARTLCHNVLVPLAAELGIDIGVTGREPLNNQPYFRMTRLGDNTPVHSGGRAAFDYMVKLVRELQKLPDEASARQALRAFIAVRIRYQPRYTDYDSGAKITSGRLPAAIQTFVQEDSENGRRAQAVVAGLLDAVAGPDLVESGRINDPSRKYPGDVCIRSVDNPDVWEKALEVRDKPVADSDIRIFAKKCIKMGVREAAIVMVSESQHPLEFEALIEWADSFGIGLTLFLGWESFVEQALFWAPEPKPVAARRAIAFIYDRLVAIEASPSGVTTWGELTKR